VTTSAIARPAGLSGLTSLEAAERRDRGQSNEVQHQTARSTASIIRANVLTRFNAIIAALAVVVLVFGDPIDAMFAIVMVLNSGIGIVQELRAKHTLDALQVLVIPTVTVLRDGQQVEIPPRSVVLGDVLKLTTGDQVPVDALVLDSRGLEADESALTGESDPVSKMVDDEVLSGSAVVAGTAWIKATRVGEDSWAHQLTKEAKDFVLTESELRRGVDTVLRVVSWILPFLAALLVWSQLASSSSFAEGMVFSVAGVVALVPQGLVLLVSMALAIAVVRLGRRDVVVQELPAVEGLARIDVLCVDKTGTLTTGHLELDEIVYLQGISADASEGGVAALTQLSAARTSTMDAIAPHVKASQVPWTQGDEVPFSSVRKWSGATFADHGTWVLGAPEIVAARIANSEALLGQVGELTASGRRVLLLAHSAEPLHDQSLPTGMRPAALVSLKEQVRDDAAETLRYFTEQGVAIKVISGDHPRTVSAVAKALGVPDAERFVEMTNIEDLESIPPETAVFGRVRPEQKRDLVRLLQARGHTVAMTGDGVNDIPSIKAADIGIAMNTATPATKAVAQLVLLDGRFSSFPDIVAEGRRVIANMERVSSLFLTKTVYATLLALIVGAAGVTFPFLPRHLSLIAAITIGVPGFILSFRTGDPVSRPGYLRRVLHFAIPAGFLAATGTFAAYWMTRSSLADATLVEARTASTITLTLLGLFVVHRLITPVNLIEGLMLAGLCMSLVLVLIPSPLSRFYALDLPPTRITAIIIAVVVGIVLTLELVLGWVGRRNARAAIQPAGPLRPNQ